MSEKKCVYNQGDGEAAESVGSKARPSFRGALRAARDQVQLYECFGRRRELEGAEELCRIIALIWVLDDGADVRIGGEIYPAAVVKDVFGFLTAEHILHVMTKFRAVKSEIQSKRAYLTTALFNSVFELDADATNQVNCL